MIYSIEGDIGAGKSTLLEELQRRGYNVSFEPYQKNPLLPRFYANPERFAGMTQAVFFPLRVDQILSLKSGEDWFIERSPYSDRWTFGEMLASAMELEEWAGYELFFNLFAAKFNIQPDVAIFIDEDPVVCLQRIKERKRPMEAAITLDYLCRLRGAHLQNFYKLGKEAIHLIAKHDSYPGTERLPESVGDRADLILSLLGLSLVSQEVSP